MGEAKPKEKISIAEYLEIGDQSEFKYEFHDGEVYAMAGGTLSHARISGNIFFELEAAFRNRKSLCKPFNTDAKVYIKAKNAFVYPDASVVCGKIEETADGNGFCNPIVIIEVLSKSTAGYDRGEKFNLYRKLPSLREYVLIEQEKALVEVFSKQENADLWKISTYEGLDASVSLESVELEIPMTQIYLDVF